MEEHSIPEILVKKKRKCYFRMPSCIGPFGSTLNLKCNSSYPGCSTF